MDSSTSSLGRHGEDRAVSWLGEQGYEILARNYRYGKGEIDIIARDGDELAFIEVKTRTNENFGHPIYALTPSKQKQIIKIARSFLYEWGITDTLVRFDVITIEWIGDKEAVEHIKDAFSER